MCNKGIKIKEQQKLRGKKWQGFILYNEIKKSTENLWCVKVCTRLQDSTVILKGRIRLKIIFYFLNMPPKIWLGSENLTLIFFLEQALQI